MISKNNENFIQIGDLDEFLDNLGKHITRRDRMKYWILRKWNNVKLLPREIKWKIQRIKYGYSDCDVWSFDDYLLDVLIGGLSQLRNSGSYPSKLKSVDEWESILSEMIDGFKIGKELINLNSFPYQKDTTDYNEYYLEKMLLKEDQEKHDKAFDLLKKWFYGLWD